MGLTLEAQQRLHRAKLDEFFKEHRDEWFDAARRAYRYVKTNFPRGSEVRPDDVAQVLGPIMHVSTRLQNKLIASRLKQKYWVSDFVDFVIDQTWDELEKDNDEQGQRRH